MSSPGPATRKPRADAERNRERLLEAAKATFAAAGTDASLEEIARQAGVGIGTLYRHFPTRDAIVAAVYQREVRQLADAATRLVHALAPAEALAAWMRLFVDYIATKKVMATALITLAGRGGNPYGSAGELITGSMELLVRNAVTAGDIRADADPQDLLYALMGFTYGNSGPAWAESALRLIDILMDGLRTTR